jgi:hypothetical protein
VIFQYEALFLGEDYRKWAFPRHGRAISLMPSLSELRSSKA